MENHESAQKSLDYITETRELIRELIKTRVDAYNGFVKHITDDERELCQDKAAEDIDDLFYYEIKELRQVVNDYQMGGAKEEYRDLTTYRVGAL